MSQILQIKSWCMLTIDGKQYFEDQILQASFTDKAGFKSDQLSISLMPNVPKPNPSSVIKFELFNDLGQYMNCGLFHVQSITRGSNKALSFTATGVEFNQKQKDKKSQHYQNTKLSSIVSLVAGRLGHEAKFKTEDIDIISLYQTDETDIQFLDRIAKDYDVLFTIKNDIAFFVNKEDESHPVYAVNAEKCMSITVKTSTKKVYKSCKVEYYDKKLAMWIPQTTSGDQPQLKVKCEAKSEAEALAKGKSKLAQAQRGTVSGNLETIGQELYAGTRLRLYDTYNHEDDGEYSIETARHTYSRSSGWVVDVEFENFKLNDKGKKR